MYLGGDEATTHLVKGLDTQLANRIKEEMRKKAIHRGVQGRGHRDDDADHYNTNKSTAIPAHTTSQHSSMGRGITRSLFGPGQLHPHRYGIPIIIQKQTRQIGQMGLNAKIKGASRRFLDGICVYNMNIDPNDVEESVPIEVYQPVQDNNEDCDTKLYVARYNEEIVTEMIAAMLRKRTGGKKAPGQQHADNNYIPQQREDNITEGMLSSQRQQPVLESAAAAVDGDVDIFAYDGGDDRNDDTKGNSSSSSLGVLAGKTNKWQQSNKARSSRNYFGGDQEQQEGEDTNDEAVTRLTRAVHEHLVAKKIEKEEESRMSLRGDFLAGGDYDECYVGYGTLEGFGHDVGVDKEFLSNKNKKNRNNKRNKRKGLDDDEDGTKKKSKMGESAQLKAVMKRVEEMKE
ncbi:hypothetical protein FOZ63_022862 [Perkinsus olseni]|uniref:RED-like N-terminal domain-containing protein n=1 Tax=Perkinsus olseni TaxID=32597 RepID=A0A7J6UEU2_PEROL|nr:hypothetical protein FOZ63_022862 [Perkinsus olseni]